jgi:hypothetical protein
VMPRRSRTIAFRRRDTHARRGRHLAQTLGDQVRNLGSANGSSSLIELSLLSLVLIVQPEVRQICLVLLQILPMLLMLGQIELLSLNVGVLLR